MATQRNKDEQVGYDAIQIFHNENAIRFPGKYKISFQRLLEILKGRVGGMFFLEGLGLGINSSGISYSRVADAMKSLSKASQGGIPAKNSDFTNALIREATSFNFEMLGDAAIETVKDISNGGVILGKKLVDAGTGIIDTAKYTVPLLILVFGVVLFLKMPKGESA